MKTTEGFWLLLPEVVEDHDVCIHVEYVVAVGRVLITGPLLWFWALEGKHVVTVFGLVVYTVKTCHLIKNTGKTRETE